LIIDEISYRLRQPERGEVVVFHYPNDESTYFIKRIVGLPGERVALKNSQVKIFNTQNPNGFVVEEDYLPSYVNTSGDKDITLKDNEYFVMGDNRSASFDSRNWGALKKAEIIGLVRLRLWPLNKVMAFEKPTY
jgi:signal peptidase I